MAKRRAAHRPRPPKLRRRRLVLLLALVAASVVSAVVVLWPGSHGAEVTLAEEAPPDRYHLTYRVTGPDLEPITKDIDVSRPYLSRVVERQRDRVVGGSLSNDEGAFQYVAGSSPRGWQLLQGGRFPATQDFRPVPVLRRAVAAGSAFVLGTDEVIGRRCTVVRTGAPLGSRLARPTDEEHVDLCIDRSGIVLFEEWTLSGDLVRRTVATVLDLAPRFDDETFRPTPAVPGVEPGSAGTPIVTELTAAEREELAARLDPPRGFRYDGGSTQFRLVDGAAPSSTVVERYRRGIDLLEVTYGLLAGDDKPPGEEVSAGDARGFLDLHLTYATLTVLGPDQRSIRIRGVDPEDVLDAGARVRFDAGTPEGDG